MSSKTIGQFLKEARKAKKLTQLAVANHLHVSPQAVSKWERCESIPDVALLPQIAELYDVTIENILDPGREEENYQKIISEINNIVDSRLYGKILDEYKATKRARDLSVPPDIFMFLNQAQKEELFTLLFEMEDYGMLIDDILPYTNSIQRISIIKKVVEKKDYGKLESLIPFMPRSIRTEILETLLKEGEYEFLEEMIPFLNHEQKDLIINFAFEHRLDYEILENYIVFFDSKQRKLVETWYIEHDNY